MKLRYIVSLFCLCISALPVGVFAQATFFWESPKQLVSIGETVEAHFFVNVADEPINAIEADIQFDPTVVSLKEMQTAGSGIVFWIESPEEKKPGMVHFSGITPGGITQQKQFLLTIRFIAKKEGTFLLESTGIRALKNDGEGSAAAVIPGSIIFHIQEANMTQTEEMGSFVFFDDTVAPEPFVPMLIQHPNLFDGAMTIVFTSQDKQSGIAGYRIREGYFGSFTTATSPYLLEDQSLNKTIFIEAIDYAGNSRRISFDPKNGYSFYPVATIFAILSIIGGIIFSWWWYVQKNK